jgi:N-acetylmuramoyl-L-alanine amidase
MTLACCGARISRVFSCLIFLTFSLLQASPAREWDVQGATRAYEDARKKQNAITQAAQPSLDQYLECAKAYRKVYFLDPHYRHAADAIYEEALIYQEMGDKFSNLAHYKIAVKRFNLLVTDYRGNQNCPDALMRMAAIYSNNLKDETAAQEATRLLRTRYKSIFNSMRQAHPEIAGEPAPQEPTKSAPIESSVARPASVQNIRYWSTRDYTRVIIDLDSDAIYKKEYLTNPDRIYFDISNAKLSKDLANRTITVGDDYLKQVRAAPYQSDLVRVVFEVSEGIDYSISELHNPFRIVIDLRGSQSLSSRVSLFQASTPRPDEVFSTPASLPAITGNENKSKSKKAESTKKSQATKGSEIAETPKSAPPTSRGDRTLTRILGLKIGRIVIDPGHGGHDQGTIGPGGLQEKHLVLSLAHLLKTMLEEKLGAEVFLTRDDDTFISLEERTAFANQHHADLFISIHANSSRIATISGVETYYLDFAKTDAEREIAARENATSDKNVRDLENLIEKIAKADKSAESRELALQVQQKLYAGARKLFSSTHNRGVRSAPFVVLIGANMPSVLVEVAFISNPKDEKLANKEANQEALAKALFAGIERYVNTLGSEMVHNQKSIIK